MRVKFKLHIGYSYGRKVSIIAMIYLPFGLIASSCVTLEPPITSEVIPAIISATETVIPPTTTNTPLPDQSAFRIAWESGPHADTYDLGKGPNTYCSRCHSPQNWDPASKVDMPPNCVTCKFPTDPELRIATTMGFVEEKDWVGITCETCHVIDQYGIAGELAWFNVITGDYEEISNPNELCDKCHANTSGVSVSGGIGVTHAVILGGSAHLNWAGEWPQADRPQYCTDCHDPHSTIAKQCVDCHDDIPTSDTHMKGLNGIMLKNVTCMACHDASGMKVGPHPDKEEGGVFVTLASSDGKSGPIIEYVKSHSIQWQVPCDRCHFEGNDWELPVFTAGGGVPEPIPTAGTGS
jgi:hypothetical protein